MTAPTALATRYEALLPDVIATHPDFTAVEQRAWARAEARRELHLYGYENPVHTLEASDPLVVAIEAALAVRGLQRRSLHVDRVDAEYDDFDGRRLHEAVYRFELRLARRPAHYWAGGWGTDTGWSDDAIAAWIAERVAGGGCSGAPVSCVRLPELRKWQRGMTKRLEP